MTRPIVPSRIRKVFDGRVFSVTVESITLPHGDHLEAEIIRHPGSVVLVPVTDRGEIVLVRQYRPAIGRWAWELPAGSLKRGEAPDFSGQQSLGACPKCGSRVFEHGVAYVCEKSAGAVPGCDFRSGKIILQQPIERAQMEKLLATGRTDLLTRFISRKGRPFKAYLVKTPGGKVGFEFMARTPKPGTAERRSAPAVRRPSAGVTPAPKPKQRAKPPAKRTRRALGNF